MIHNKRKIAEKNSIYQIGTATCEQIKRTRQPNILKNTTFLDQKIEKKKFFLITSLNSYIKINRIIRSFSFFDRPKYAKQ